MQVIAEILLGIVIVVVLVPAFIGATIMGCQKKRHKEEQE